MVSTNRADRPSEHARLWRAAALPDLEVMDATFWRHHFSPHFHETYVIQWVQAGCDQFECGGARHLASAGDVVLLNPGDVHTGQPCGESPLCYHSLYPSLEFMVELMDCDGYRSQTLPRFRTPVIRDPLLAQRLGRLHGLLQSSASSLAVAGALAQMADRLMLYAESAPSPGPRHHPPQIVHARDFLLEHLSRSVSLQELSGQIGLSPYYLLRTFRKAYGLPPHRFVLNARIELSKHLLARGTPINQVALQTGFADQSHLTRHFKRIVGVTPGEYAQIEKRTRYP